MSVLQENAATIALSERDSLNKANPTRISLAVALCSCAVLITEIALTRIFSVTLMYHYAFLVLSITLFGLGLGGMFHFVSGTFRNRPQSVPWLALTAAVALPLCLGLVLRMPFHPQLLSASNAAVLAAIVFLTSIPFFLAGLFLSALYVLNRKAISNLYAFDLAGAAIGCGLAIYLVGVVGAPLAPVVSSLLWLASAALVRRRQHDLLFDTSMIAGVLLISLLVFIGWMKLSVVKGHSEENLEFEKWNAFSRIAVSRSGDHRLIQIDADAATEILSDAARRSGLESFAGITRLPYLLRRDSKVLVVGPGGGREVGAALVTGNTVTGVEINPIIAHDLMMDRYSAFTGGLFTSPGVRIVTADARSYLERTEDKYDVIQENAVDTWAAVSGGGFTLSESYLYTEEAFETYFKHLTPDGILTLGRWEFRQPQQIIRVISLALEALDHRYPRDNRSRFFLVTDSSYAEGGGTPAVVLIKKTPFTASELQTLRQAAAESHYNIAYDPVLSGSNTYVELINSGDRQRFFSTYPLNIRPPDDDKPFFFFTLKWRDILTVWNTPEESRKNNSALFLLVGVGGIMIVLTALTFVLPLTIRRQSRIGKFAGLYFLCIGLAFMMVETVLTQKGILFLGQPTYSFAAVLCALLLGAGAGSWFTRDTEASLLGRYAVRLAIVIGIAIAVLPLWLAWGFRFSLALRFVWIVIPLFGLGMLLGQWFPIGLRKVGELQVPWAWALNGSASVLGSILAVVFAMQVGFAAVLWIAVAFYALAAAAAFRF
jgi:predicted membrane-bound spermidine synthase